MGEFKELDKLDQRKLKKQELDEKYYSIENFNKNENNLIRYLILVIDLTKSMKNNDLKPTRL